jgi:Protein of unknown function (DUF2914)
MLRACSVLATIVLFSTSGFAADLVWMKLCTSKDFDAAANDCAEGKVLQGNEITIDPTKVGGLNFLTAVRLSEDTEIYHVWIMETKSSGTVLFYDASSKMLRQAYKQELDWLKERKIEGAKVIVKMTGLASPAYRLRSRKTLTPAMSGSWKVQVYDATTTAPLGELQFTVGVPDRGITN